jgi:SAM-dependent methyltransferase
MQMLRGDQVLHSAMTFIKTIGCYNSKIMEHELKAYADKYDVLTLQSKTFKRIAKIYNLKEKRVLDIGCGVGSHMQRFGPKSVGLTTNPKEVSLGAVINRDIRLGNVERLSDIFSEEEQFDVIWCNNIFEHLLSPHAFLVYLKKYSHENTIIILGTPMIPVIPGLMRIKKFRGALATPHVNFFTYDTYKYTALYAGWKIQTISPFLFASNLLNFFARRFMPHLYLVAKNDTTYRYHVKKLKEWEDDSLYQPLIKIMNP